MTVVDRALLPRDLYFNWSAMNSPYGKRYPSTRNCRFLVQHWYVVSRTCNTFYTISYDTCRLFTCMHIFSYDICVDFMDTAFRVNEKLFLPYREYLYSYLGGQAVKHCSFLSIDLRFRESLPIMSNHFIQTCTTGLINLRIKLSCPLNTTLPFRFRVQP